MHRTPSLLLLMVLCTRTMGKPQDADYVGATRVRLRRVYMNTPDYECNKVTRTIEVSCPEPYIPWCDEIIYVSTSPQPSSSDGLVTKYVCPPAVIYCKERDCKTDTTEATTEASSSPPPPPPPPIFLPPPIFMAPPPPPPCWCAPMAPMCPCPGPPPMPMPMPMPMMPPMPMFPPPMFPPPIFPPLPPPSPPCTSTSTTKKGSGENELRMPGLGKGGMDLFLGVPKSRFGRRNSQVVEQGRMVPDDGDDDDDDELDN